MTRPAWSTIALALTLALMAPAPALAQRVSAIAGRTLQADCTGANATACDAYVAGIADAIALQPGGGLAACIRPEVTGSQLRAVVLTYLHDHPRDLAGHAGHLVMHALVAAYPCR